jgi:hypothetical protein
VFAACNIVPWDEITISLLGKYHDNTEETEQDIDCQYLQMAMSVCGSWHLATHFLNLSLIKDSLASFYSTLLAFGGQDLADGNRNVVTLEEYMWRLPRLPAASSGSSSLHCC